MRSKLGLLKKLPIWDFFKDLIELINGKFLLES
jgi:hypothetical protein